MSKIISTMCRINKKLFITICVLGLISSIFANAQTRRRQAVKPVEISSFVFNKDIWETKITDFAKNLSHRKLRFKWQSAAKKGLRSEGYGFRMLGVKAGECVIISHQGKEIKGVSLSLYNKGDDGRISVTSFNKLRNKLRDEITKKLSVKSRLVKRRGTVTTESDEWKWEGSLYRLEGSKSVSGQPEFLRFRAMSQRTANRGESTASRSSLKANLRKVSKTGEVFIDNIPMVDQGAKGYCACATAARIYQYYGRTTDQHEIAQIAGSSALRGTSAAEMVAALKKVTRKLNSRVNIVYEYPKGLTAKNDDFRKFYSGYKSMIRDFNAYQQLAKRRKGKSIEIAGRKPYSKISSKAMKSGDIGISFSYFAKTCDPKLYRDVMMKKGSYSRFKNKVKEYIDQGIPICWGLRLGMFPEEGSEQLSGGHMRLIIGYNFKTDQLIYSDSWGAGHEKKTMDMGEAFSMTNVILVLPPTK